MIRILAFATCAFFFLGASFAHEVAVAPVVTTHKTIIERRIVQLNEKIGALCVTHYTTTIVNGVKGATGKSVDCEE